MLKVEDFPITSRLLNLTKNARSAYQTFLENEQSEKIVSAKRKMEMAENETKAKKAKQEMLSLNEQIAEEEIKLEAAKNILDSGHELLNSGLKETVVKKAKIVEANSLIQLATEKMNTITPEIAALKAALEKLKKKESKKK